MLNDALFRADGVVEKSVTLSDGTVHVMHFRELSAARFSVYFAAQKADDEPKREAEQAKLIAASLCEPDGSPALSIERAAMLKAGAAAGIMAAIYEVNGLTEKTAPGKA